MRLTGISAHHEIYEDLGIHSTSVLDPSFNVEHFGVLGLSQDDVDRAMSFEYRLSGTTSLTNYARQLATERQLPRSTRGSSGSRSPTALNAPATASEHTTGVFAPISGLEKPQYLSNEETAHLASLYNPTSAAGESSGLNFLSPLDELLDPTENDVEMPPIDEHTCTNCDMAVSEANTFRFPNWDELPEDLQNPTSSADFHSTIPISNAEGSADNVMAWDNDDMNFAMDMDLDLGLDLNVFGQC